MADLQNVSSVDKPIDIIEKINNNFSEIEMRKVDHDGAKVLTDENYSTSEKQKLATVDEYANNYTLPDASTTTKGGIKVGGGLSINGDILSADVQSDANFTNEYKNKLDIALTSENILNATSQSTTDVYSANFVESKFATKAFLTPVYYEKVSDLLANLVTEKPVVSDSNYMEDIMETSTFLEEPDIIIRRTVETPITYTDNNSLTIDAIAQFNKPCTVEILIRVFGRTTETSEWLALSAPKIIGQATYSGASDFSITCDLPPISLQLDEIPGAFNIEVGGAIEIRCWIREIVANGNSVQRVIIRTLCGVAVEGYDRYSVAQLSSSSVSINTSQIDDGAVTMSKLSTDVVNDISGAVRFDEEQILSQEDKERVLENIGALSATDTAANEGKILVVGNGGNIIAVNKYEYITFSTGDDRWGALTNGIYTLTISDERLPIRCEKQSNNIYYEIVATIGHDDSNIYIISDAKFSGRILVI